MTVLEQLENAIVDAHLTSDGPLHVHVHPNLDTDEVFIDVTVRATIQKADIQALNQISTESNPKAMMRRFIGPRINSVLIAAQVLRDLEE